MKPVYIKFGAYIDYGVERNDKYPNLKVGNHGRISKYKIQNFKMNLVVTKQNMRRIR